jgi:ABC-type anion transport system duplicated permease subunit
MLRSRQVSLGAVIWLVVGVIVASGHNFFAHLMTVTQILSAIMAVLLWPLVLFHIHAGI